MRSLSLSLIALTLAVPAGAAKPAPDKAAKSAAEKPAKKAPKAGPDLPSRAPADGRLGSVNGETIPLSLYLDRLSLRYGPEVREMLIDEAIIRQEAKRRGISVSAAELDAMVKKAYADSVKRYGDEQRLTEELKKSRGWTPDDYREVIRLQADAQVLRTKLGESLVKAAAVTDEAVQKYYDEHKQEFAQPEAVRISHILIRRPEEEGADASARSKAEALLKKIRDARGANFEAVAKESSEDRLTGGQGGRLPIWYGRGQHPYGAAFDEKVFAAPVGLVPEVVPAPDGYHLVRVDEKREGKVLSFAQVRDTIRATMLRQQRDRALDELFVRLRTQARIEIGKY